LIDAIAWQVYRAGVDLRVAGTAVIDVQMAVAIEVRVRSGAPGTCSEPPKDEQQ